MQLCSVAALGITMKIWCRGTERVANVHGQNAWSSGRYNHQLSEGICLNWGLGHSELEMKEEQRSAVWGS